MILKELLDISTEKLNKAGIEASTHEAGVILCNALKVNRAFLYAHPEKVLSVEDADKVHALIEKRCERIPLQHLLGVQEFMSLDFKVNENVLIPRQDTEILVETVISHCRKVHGPKRLLDMGTGSGAIAVSLAKYIDEAQVTAVDISEKALSVARENAALNGVQDKLTFIQSDLYERLHKEEKAYDVIVSNPPYIPTEDIKGLEPEVRDCEPILALDGGGDGLDFYRKLTENAEEYLKPCGLLAFEVGIYQAGSVTKLLESYGFTDIKVIKDLSGIERVVSGRLTPSRSV